MSLGAERGNRQACAGIARLPLERRRCALHRTAAPGGGRACTNILRRVGSTRWLRTPPRDSVKLFATAVLTLQAAAAALSQRRAFVLKRDYVRVSPVPDAETGAAPVRSGCVRFSLARGPLSANRCTSAGERRMRVDNTDHDEGEASPTQIGARPPQCARVILVTRPSGISPFTWHCRTAAERLAAPKLALSRSIRA